MKIVDTLKSENITIVAIVFVVGTSATCVFKHATNMLMKV